MFFETFFVFGGEVAGFFGGLDLVEDSFELDGGFEG